MSGTAIDVDGLVVTGGWRVILSVPRLTVVPGEVLVVLGPNGAGKSTLLQCCVGMVRAQRGRIHVLGQPVHRLRSLALTQLRRRVAYLAQILARGGETPLTLREVVAIGRTGRVGLLRPLRSSDWQLVDQWVERFGLSTLAGQPYRTLSGGEQRKVLLAMAMVQQPELLLLDEPTANLDAYWREQIVRALDDLHAQVGLTIVLVCHDLEAIPTCARQLLVLCGGQVAGQGAAADVLEQSLIRELYGEGLTVLRRGSRFLLGRILEEVCLDGLALLDACAVCRAGGGSVHRLARRVHCRHADSVGDLHCACGLGGGSIWRVIRTDRAGPLVPALAAASLAAVLVGVLDPQTVRADINVILGILFSLMMGLAFLGLGLFSLFGVSDNEVRNLLWGSLAFCRWRDVWIMITAGVAELLFVGLLYKEMRAILFSRTHAAAAGIHVTLVWTLFLLLASLVLTVNFQTVGGLMIYSLLANPAVAAGQLVRGYGPTLLVSAVLGAVSGLGGLLISATTDLPTGAMIVILSSLLVVVAMAIRRWMDRRGIA